MTPTTSEREAKEVATFIEQMDMLREDFTKYEAGHPDYPFVLIRDSVIAALNQYDRAYAALTRELRALSDDTDIESELDELRQRVSGSLNAAPEEPR